MIEGNGWMVEAAESEEPPVITDEENRIGGVGSIDMRSGRTSEENPVFDVILETKSRYTQDHIDRFELIDDGRAVHIESVEVDKASGRLYEDGVAGPYRLSVRRLLGRYDVDRIEGKSGVVLGEVTVVDPDA